MNIIQTILVSIAMASLIAGLITNGRKSLALTAFGSFNLNLATFIHN